MTTLIVDDDRLFRNGIRRIIPGVKWEASSIEEGLRLAAERQPAVILLDVWFDGGKRTGIDALADFHGVCPRCQIVIATGMFNAKEAERALAYGAVAYLGKLYPQRIRAYVVAARAFVSSVFVDPQNPALH